MYNAFFEEICCKGVFDRFASVFFTAVGVKEFEFVSGLTFNHCEPAFKNSKDSIRKFVGDCINPRVIGSQIEKGENILRIAKRDWVYLTADVGRDTKERDFRFVADCNQKGRAGLLAKYTEIIVLWIELDAQLSKTFLRGVKESIMDEEAVCTIFH